MQWNWRFVSYLTTHEWFLIVPQKQNAKYKYE